MPLFPGLVFPVSQLNPVNLHTVSGFSLGGAGNDPGFFRISVRTKEEESGRCLTAPAFMFMPRS